MPLRLDLIFLFFIEISDIFCFQVTKKNIFFSIFFFDHFSAKVPKSIFISRNMIKCVRSFNHTSKKKKKANFIFFLKHKSFWKNKREREKLMVSPNNFLEFICLHFTCIFFSDFFFSKCLLKKVQNFLCKKTRK